VQKVLQRYNDLQDIIAILGMAELSPEDKTTVFFEQIAAVTPEGFRRANGETHEVDVIICATGFDTSFKPMFPIIAHGRNLQDEYTEGVTSYLGLSAPEVPNYFITIGPYGPLTQGSVLPLSELYTEYFMRVIRKVQTDDIKYLEPKREICKAFCEHADLFLKGTVWTQPCNSWFKNGTATGKPLVWPGSRVHSLAILEETRFEHFNYAYLYSNPMSFLGNGWHERQLDGRDITWYYGLIDGKDKQPTDFRLD